MQFSYRVADRRGVIESGREEADSREQLIAKLKSQGKFPLEVKEESAKSLVQANWKFSRKKLSAQDRLNFTQQLGNLLSAGIPLERSLAVLSRLTTESEMGNVIGQLRRHLQEGLSFTAALERFPHHFPELYINMVRAGEAGGMLPQVLNRLVQYLQDEIELRRFIVSSLFYPMIVLAASVAAIFFYVGVVIPKFQSIFEDMGSELPFVTRLVMAFGTGLWQYWWVLAGLLIAGISWYAKEWSTSEGRLRIDALKLKSPLVGPILERIATARMAMSLSLLAGSGVPLLESIGITRKLVGNAVLSRALWEVEKSVQQGNTLAHSMAAQQAFPILAVEMIGVGEESGSIVPMLDQVAKTFEGEVKHSLAMFLSIFEPVLILGMVGIIAVLAVAILLPVLTMNAELNPLG